jgi:xanthine dehydrogenase accessory factor
MKVWPTIERLVRTEGRCAMVTVVKVEGSAPREAGARIIVSSQGYHGTIGGGALEWRAIAQAQAMLGQGGPPRLTSHALGPELGQCCGGRVDLVTEVFEQASLIFIEKQAARELAGVFTLRGRIVSSDFEERFGEERRPLFLFGAGHVGRALVLALAQLPFEIRWIDSREGAFPQAVPQNVTCIQAAGPAEELKNAAAGSFVLIMTHSHALDLAITEAALRDPKFPYVGLIGSASKRARFEARLRKGGVVEERIRDLICPIGVPGIKAKLPAIIAASTAAQLLERDELLRSDKKHVNMGATQASMAS